MQAMKDPNTDKKNHKTIKIELAEQDFNQVSEQAKQMKVFFKFLKRQRNITVRKP